ncbi:Alpha/Beta hydrolase protein [Rhypophila decipiens]|uniref:Alpha/Beta hydrolase protein n=1 Tax=Rhypophila decipiens TaxID=261697 RepID=A0AAN6Y7M2_9PEZI|nr:Alpha/Beta hydrolase protein [Rhypophila decipiens]
MAPITRALVAILGVVGYGAVNAAPSPKGLKGDLSILINNDLQGPSSPHSTSGVILLGGRHSFADASAACLALGEQLWSPELKTASIQPNLDYYKYYKGIKSNSTGGVFWIAPAQNGISETQPVIARTINTSGSIASVANSNQTHPALCTQTAPYSTQSSQNTSTAWQVQVEANNQTLTGYRDRLSFRFLGIRYAPQPKRFTYPEPFTGHGENVSALQYGSQCVQGSSGGSEDCLFLNVWTPHLPRRPGCKKSLRPVGIWIHGGAFTGGTANDATFDGGNIVSRGDMVLVAINYRLSTLGFLALNDSTTNGNFGLADQILALDWVRAHIASFGGDPDRITLFGQSAGAASVRAMMASPMAANKFASAILLSNLGGLNYGTTYSKYYTIDQQLSVAGNAILNLTNCTTAQSQVDCLRSIPANTLTSLSTVARYIVQDGTYITTPELISPSTASLRPDLKGINLMLGTTRDDGAPFITFPSPTTNQSSYLISSGFDPSLASESLFPIPQYSPANQTKSLYNSTSRLATDAIFRCVDSATVHAGQKSSLLPSKIWYYEFDRTYQTNGWPGTDVCNPPKTATRPNGDPSKEYFKCHSGELYYVFGNLARQGLPMRDENDLPFEQLVLDMFAAFIREGDPNQGVAVEGGGGYLRARGYDDRKEGFGSGRWEPSESGKTTMRVLDWPGYQTGFRETEQCKAIGLGLEDYYGV